MAFTVQYLPNNVLSQDIWPYGNRVRSILAPTQVEYRRFCRVERTPVSLFNLSSFLIECDVYVTTVMSASSSDPFPDAIPSLNMYYIKGIDIFNAGPNTPLPMDYYGNESERQGDIRFGWQIVDDFASNNSPASLVLHIRHFFIPFADYGPVPITSRSFMDGRLTKDHLLNPNHLDNKGYVADIYSNNREVRYGTHFVHRVTGESMFFPVATRPAVAELSFYENRDNSNLFASRMPLVLPEFPRVDRVPADPNSFYTLNYGELNTVNFRIHPDTNPAYAGCAPLKMPSLAFTKYHVYIFETEFSSDTVSTAEAYNIRGQSGPFAAQFNTITSEMSVLGVFNGGAIANVRFSASSLPNDGNFDVYVDIDGYKLRPGAQYRVALVVDLGFGASICCPACTEPQSSFSYLSQVLDTGFKLNIDDNLCLNRNGFTGLMGTYGPNIITCPLDKLASEVSIDWTLYNGNTDLQFPFDTSVTSIEYRLTSFSKTDPSNYDVLLSKRSAGPVTNASGVFDRASYVNGLLSLKLDFDILESPNRSNIATLVNNSTPAPAQSNMDWRNRLLEGEWIISLTNILVEFDIPVDVQIVVKQSIFVRAEADPLFVTESTPDKKVLCEEDDIQLEFCTKAVIAVTSMSGSNMLNRVALHAAPFNSNANTLELSSSAPETSDFIERQSDLYDVTNEACASIDLSGYLNKRNESSLTFRTYHQALSSGYAMNFDGADRSFLHITDDGTFTSSDNSTTISAWINLKSIVPVNEARYILYKGSYHGVDLKSLSMVSPQGNQPYLLAQCPEFFLKVINIGGSMCIAGGWRIAIPALLNNVGNQRSLEWRTNPSSVTINTDEWVHILWVKPHLSYQVATQEVYINGVKQASLNSVNNSLRPGQHSWDTLTADDGAFFEYNAFGVPVRSTVPGIVNNGSYTIGRKAYCNPVMPDNSILTTDSLDAYIKEVRLQKTYYSELEALDYYREGLGGLGKDNCTDVFWLRGNQNSGRAIFDYANSNTVNIVTAGQYAYSTSPFTIIDCTAINLANYGVPVSKFNRNGGFWVEC